ncbi:MAG: hypothetical protein ABIE03_01875 [Patescibacteria group bacterium]
MAVLSQLKSRKDILIIVVPRKKGNAIKNMYDLKKSKVRLAKY